jgi:FkbM family methyltransferase
MSFKNLKYRFFINFFENKKKLIWTLKNNLFNNVVCPPTISVVKLTQNTILGKKNERMFVVNDSFQSWNVINDAYFQIEFIKKIKSLLTSSIKYDFVDIGANIGIMTKCLLNNNVRLKNIYCVEPDQDNFFCLKNNLAKFKNIKFFKFALDKKKGKKKLYIDNNNKGNLSFFYEMIKKDRLNYMNTQNSFEIIKCENIKNFFKSIKLKTNIIKIDTQGSDEIIFQEIPREVLNKNHLLIIEITPLNTKEINYRKYSKNLNHYSKFTDFNGKFYTKDEVIKLSQRKRGKNIDLIFLK